MIIKKNIVGKLSTNSYLIIDEISKKAAIIDPGFESEKIIEFIDNEDCILKYIILTHAHFDHAFEVSAIKEKYNAKIIAHKNSKIVLSDDNHNLAKDFLGKSINIEINKNDIFLEDDEKIKVGNIEVKLIHIGGHTIDSSAFYIERENIIFTGDTLFYESIGRTDFYYGNYEILINNIKNKILILEDKTIVYPGHGIDTTIKHEKEKNIYLK